MSARTPVALIYLPNQPFLLGTFDTTKFTNWWKSKPFPDTIEYIKKGMHVYGRKHLTIAKRTDGRWAVYLSKNYGIDWELVFLAAEGEVIYDMLLIKFGWVILNTSDGFYESVKAGSDGSWTKISSLPGASAVPAFCNIGGGDIILCTDGRYIWRSTNKARSWTLVCDQRQVPGRKYYRKLIGFPSPNNYEGGDGGYLWSGSPLYPSIDGANGIVICAYGPFITISMDWGANWYSWGYKGFACRNNWDGYFEDVHRGPPKPIIYDRFPDSSNGPAKFVIKQILVSSVKGPSIEDVTFLIRTDDLVVASGQTKLLSRVFYGEFGHMYIAEFGEGGDDISPYWSYKFQQFLSPDDNLNQLSMYETAIVGSSGLSRLVVSAQTTVDGNGNSIPSFKHSKDGGKTWTTLDVSAVKVSDGEGLPPSSGAFVDDYYVKSTWVGSKCDNVGNWTTKEGWRVQCQSYEMDLALESGERDVEKPQSVDAIIEKDGEEPESVDAILAELPTNPYPVDGLFEGVGTKTYRIDRTLEGISEKEVSVDSIVTKDKSEDDSVDAIFEKNIRLIYKVGVGLHDKNSRLYLVDTKLVKDDLNKRLARVRRTFPQVFDLWLPEIPQGVYNSVWEIIE